GKLFTPSNKEGENLLVVPSAHKYPLYALESSEVDIFTGNKDNMVFIEENTINDEWISAKEKILSEIKKREKGIPLKVMVLGISSGKTTFIKYLANNLLREGLYGGYLDSDLGQQLMYLPTTLNIGKIQDFIVSSADIKAEETVFIGSTFPKSNFKFIVSHSCKDLIDNYIKLHSDTRFILIDTDGWIKTEAGVIYKTFFINTVNPDIIVMFQDETVEELKEIEKEASKSKTRKIIIFKQKNKYFYEKDKEERRFLRQSQFAKILEEYRKITIPLNNIKFIKSDYDKDNDKVLEVEINKANLVNLPYHYVIISLMNEDSKMIKIGLLFVINVEKDYILLYSDMNYKEQTEVKKILLGSLRLSTKGNHQGYLYL
ncbi:MAG: Clp1/GlmU family protein, partial [Candidatus Thorarchaeota archaeon]